MDSTSEHVRFRPSKATYLNRSMDDSTSLKADSCLATSYEYLLHVLERKVYYLSYKYQPLNPILRQMNSIRYICLGFTLRLKYEH